MLDDQGAGGPRIKEITPLGVTIYEPIEGDIRDERVALKILAHMDARSGRWSEFDRRRAERREEWRRAMRDVEPPARRSRKGRVLARAKAK